jgi:hypothetical protein
MNTLEKKIFEEKKTVNKKSLKFGPEEEKSPSF